MTNQEPSKPREEVWKEIPGFEDYEVSDMGGFRKGSRSLKLSKDKRTGYFRLCVSKNGKTKSTSAGRVFLTVFVGQPASPDMEAAHLNGDPSDNRLENLKWTTHLENESHKTLHNTRLIGERHCLSKLNNEQVFEIRELSKQGLSLSKLAKKFNVSIPLISAIKNRLLWAHLPELNGDNELNN